MRVGTGLLVVKDGNVLIGKRKNSHAAGLYSFPGGHLDWNETWAECVLRELREECGEDIKVVMRDRNISRPEFFVTNDIMPECNKHYITIFMVADWVSGEPQNTEPDKCEGWEWVSYDKLLLMSQNNQCANWIPMNLIIDYRHRIGI